MDDQRTDRTSNEMKPIMAFFAIACAVVGAIGGLALFGNREQVIGGAITGGCILFVIGVILVVKAKKN